jgi:hypothetical protein
MGYRLWGLSLNFVGTVLVGYHDPIIGGIRKLRRQLGRGWGK